MDPDTKSVETEPWSTLEADLSVSVLNGTTLPVPLWEAALAGVVLSIIWILTLVGNTLVILSVFTYRPLRITPNFFIVSLAMTDITVALLDFPLSVPSAVTGQWTLGVTMCQIWLSLNVLCCAASILHLCAIALDRYWAINNPIAYAKERTLRRVLVVIGVIWVVSMAMSFPLLMRWNETLEQFDQENICTLWLYEKEVAAVYIVIFYATLLAMIILYARIYVTMRRRLRDRRYSALQAGKSPVFPVTDVTSTQSNLEGQEPVEASKQDGSQCTIREALRHEGEPAGCGSGHKELEEKHPPSSSWSNNDFVKGDGGGKGEGLRLKKLKWLGEGSSLCDDSVDRSFGKNVMHEAAVKVAEGKFNGSPARHWAISVTDEETARQVSSTAKISGRILNIKQQLVEERQRISLSKERRLAKTLGFVMGVFVVCWLPFFITYISKLICSSWHPTQKLLNLITWLGYVNSTLNPIIFTVFNMEFRRAFKRLLHMKP